MAEENQTEETQTADELQAGQFTPPEATANLLTEVTEQADLDTAATPALPTGTVVPFQEQQVQESELFTPTQVAAPVTEPVKEASVTGLELPTPPRTAAATYQSFVSEDTPEFAAAQGQVSAQSLIGDIEGAVSEESIAQGATAELDEKATLKFQMGELFKSFEEGKPPPAWAAPAVRQVGGMMAQRGLGRSSMAAAAISQAIMESGIPIAQQDANKYATIQLQNLNNQQQATLQNAATYAAMDRANMGVRVQAATDNAKAFLTLDVKDMDNAQRVNEINHQTNTQKMLTDISQENASRQFNAKTENEVNEFFAELNAQIGNSNSNRQASISQVNADQANAMNRFVAQMKDSRDKFDANMATQILQSNAQWRRDINTRDTAAQNEANRINAANLLGINRQAHANLWQRYRDEAQWVMQSSESNLQRAHQSAMIAQEAEVQSEFYDKQFKDAAAVSVGQGAYNLLMGGLFG